MAGDNLTNRLWLRVRHDERLAKCIVVHEHGLHSDIEIFD
jgi:hypothetical protein